MDSQSFIGMAMDDLLLNLVNFTRVESFHLSFEPSSVLHSRPEVWRRSGVRPVPRSEEVSSRSEEV